MTVSSWDAAEVPAAAAALGAAGYSRVLACLLARRQITDADAAARFLAPSLEQLHDPASMRGLPAAVARLRAARDRGERVAVVGDYDVDGVSGTALLSAVLMACGVDTLPILPHRLLDGYGFQPVHAARAKDAGCSLVVTVDCGTTSIAAADAAIAAGLEVVITDHHLPGDTPLPAGVLLVNPHQDGCTYPFSDLSGAGLAFKLAQAVARACGRNIPAGQLLRLACLGTIADLVPLVGENRVIAAVGLEELERTRSVGLRALLAVAGVRGALDADDVGFRIGPRLNAPGRLGSSEKALELLLCRDLLRARTLAGELDRFNRQRQEAERRVVESARRMIGARDELAPILVAWHHEWHRGVVGVAAGRLARELHRPTLLLAVDGDLATGSGRSVAGIALHAFLDRWRDDFERFGGHAQAIGLTVRRDRLEALRASFEQAAEVWRPQLACCHHAYELEIEAREANENLLAELARLEPFGQGNPRPLLRVRGPLRLLAPPRLFGKDHLAAQAGAPGGGMLRLLGWGWAPRRAQLEGCFEVLGFLERDHYRGGVTLRLVDARAVTHAAGDPDRVAAHASPAT